MAASRVAVSGASVDESALRSALRKAWWRILPLLSICYLVAYMDRGNISFAAESMNRDLHFTPKIYGLGAGLFFLSYALCEIPSNALLLRFGARRWLARIMLTWGLLAAAMMLVRTPGHFYGARLLLGCAEAGYFPGAVYYLSQWFPSAVRARTMGLFYVSLPISTIVMGGLAGALLRLNGTLGLAGWQWMFVVEAAPAVVLSAVVWFGLPKDIASAGWLNGAERGALTAKLAKDTQGNPEAHGSTLGTALRSGRVWTLGFIYFCVVGTFYAVAFSLPMLLTRLTGWNTGQAGYLIAGTGAVGALALLGNAWHSDRTGDRRLHIAVWFILMGAGTLVAGLHLSGWIGATALLLVMLSWYALLGPLTGVLATILPGKASAIALATVNTCGIAGGFMGPYYMGWMCEATGGYALGIGLLCLPCLLAAMGILRLVRRDPES